MTFAIRAENIGKKFSISRHHRVQYQTLRDRIVTGVASLLEHIPVEVIEEFWALREVSFELAAGERLGIIGRNGAGKSTLLKILSRIIEPSLGKVRIRGRVASLLEVGTGFHPELTGRENVFLNGAILGMTRAEIKRNFDRIVEFAEMGKFIDTPVKRYSSGMYMRLAFAIAAHLDAENLLVDEVLAVGDIEFQRRCLERMGEISKEGRTIVFVTHDLNALTKLTTKAIMIESGRIAAIGISGEIAARYLQSFPKSEYSYRKNLTGADSGLVEVVVSPSISEGHHRFGDPLRIKVTIENLKPVRSPCLSFLIMSDRGIPATHCWVFGSQFAGLAEVGRCTLTCSIPSLRLYEGSYSLTVFWASRSGHDEIDRQSDICPFQVTMEGHVREFPWQSGVCIYLEHAEWQQEVLK